MYVMKTKNYFLTLSFTLAFGLMNQVNAQCLVEVTSLNPAVPELQAQVMDSNFTFVWSTGETSWNILAATSGNYCVTATDVSGATCTDCFLVDLADYNSCASYIDLAIDALGLNAQLYAEDPALTYTYLWSNGATTPSITGIPAGFYEVTVTSSSGCSSQATYSYYGAPISGSTCPLHLQAFSYVDPAFPSDVFLSYSFSGGSPVDFLWSFGDGNTSTLATPVYTYSSGGTYFVCVSATDVSGCISDTACTQVDITTLALARSAASANRLVVSTDLARTLDSMSTSSPTSVKSISLQNNVQLFPNPVRDQLSFLAGELVDINIPLTISDLLGNKIISRTLNQKGEHVETVSVAALKPGVYLINYSNNGIIQSGRFVKN